MKKMNELNSDARVKLFEIACDTSNSQSIVSAIVENTDFTQDEAEEYIGTEWCEICKDGVVIWAEMW